MVNAIVLGLETYDEVTVAAGNALVAVEALCLTWFAAELAARALRAVRSALTDRLTAALAERFTPEEIDQLRVATPLIERSRNSSNAAHRTIGGARKHRTT